MIGMVIADDELNIRQGLLTIPWKDFGIEVRGVASNGEEALSLIRSYHPEILLTDIRMPNIDGLMLIEAARAELPSIKAILLTGYQDFTYAHTAIRLGAFGYVLKPSDPDEIIDVVLKAKAQVEQDIRIKNTHEQLRKEFDGYRPAMLNFFLQSLICGRITDSDTISKKCAALGLELDNYVVMIIEFSAADVKQANGLLSSLKEEICNISAGYGKSHVLDINYSTLCLVNELPGPGKPSKQEMLALASEIRDSLNTKFSECVSIGISKCFNSASDMFAAFNQATNCLKLKACPQEGMVIHVEDFAAQSKIINEILEYIESSYMQDISLNTLSEHIHMNHIYISRLIKRETGETFLDILTRVRMKKACELLKILELKTYEISSLIGIKDSGYFSQVFKKYSGATPSEYRERLLSKSKSGGEVPL